MLTTNSYGVEIGYTWCYWKTCGRYNLPMERKEDQKSKLNNILSFYILPKEQKTTFESQEILGIMIDYFCLHVINKPFKN